MPNDDAFEFLRQQLAMLAQRVERLEGKVAQLRAEANQPGLMYPNRREFQQLEDRVKKLEGEP
jgi:BMFP domain-containing protein YqiC